MRTIAKLCAVVLLVGIGLSFLDSPLADPCQRNPVWTETTSLPADRAGAGAEVSPHNWVYVACGSGPGYMTSVIGAPIDPETGELGEWIEMTSLPISRVHPALHWWNGYLYAAGGYNAGSGSLYNVHSAPVHQDGTIGDWTEQGSLAVAHNGENHSFIRDGKLCLISCGASHTPPVVRIQVAELLADGQLGGWTVIMTLQTERYYPVAVATDTHLFLIAGDLGGETTGLIERGRFLPDGTIDEWTVMDPLPVPLQNMGVISYPKPGSVPREYEIVLVGGWSWALPGHCPGLPTIWKINVDVAGEITGCFPIGSLAVPIMSTTGIAWDQHLYLIGGEPGPWGGGGGIYSGVWHHYEPDAFSDAPESPRVTNTILELGVTSSNPFSHTVSLRAASARAMRGSLGIYDAKGRLVKSLYNGEMSGELSVSWDGSDAQSRPVNSGVYFAKWSGPLGSTARTIVLAR